MNEILYSLLIRNRNMCLTIAVSYYVRAFLSIPLKVVRERLSRIEGEYIRRIVGVGGPLSLKFIHLPLAPTVVACRCSIQLLAHDYLLLGREFSLTHFLIVPVAP